MDFLRSVPANKFGEASRAFERHLFKPVTFKPVVDGLVLGEDGFLPEDPWYMLKKGNFNKVDLIDH